MACVQRVERRERPPFPCALRDPGRMLEHGAEARDERLLVLRDIHVGGNIRGIYTTCAMLSPERIMQRCDALARHSELPGGLTRVFLSPESRAANELVLGWMREAGMKAELDAIGNVRGRYEGERPGLPCLMLGSHLDTVRDAGRYDGMLGVISAIECVDFLNSQKKRLPFALEVIGFGDEEGVRFGTTLLGSRAVAGTFDKETLNTVDAKGISMEQALRDFGLEPKNIPQVAKKKGEVLAYAELHIEQGPVLEAEGLPVGRGDGDQRLLAPARHARRPGRARRHGADEPAARRPRRRRRMRSCSRAHREDLCRCRRHSGADRSKPGRHQRDSRGRSCSPSTCARRRTNCAVHASLPCGRK